MLHRKQLDFFQFLEEKSLIRTEEVSWMRGSTSSRNQNKSNFLRYSTSVFRYTRGLELHLSRLISLLHSYVTLIIVIFCVYLSIKTVFIVINVNILCISACIKSGYQVKHLQNLQFQKYFHWCRLKGFPSFNILKYLTDITAQCYDGQF